MLTHSIVLIFAEWQSDLVIYMYLYLYMGFPSGLEGKASACYAGDLGSIPELGRSPGEGNGNPLQWVA